MPIYEYECKKCGRKFEEFSSSITKAKKPKCECGSRSVQKLISNTSFILKGSGWYVTDYKNRSKTPKEKKVKNKAASKTTAESKEKTTTKKETSSEKKKTTETKKEK